MASASITGVDFDGHKLRSGRFGRETGAAGVLVSEIDDFTAATVIARKSKTADVVARLSGIVGLTVEDLPKRVASPELAITGVGPGQWLAVQRGGTRADLVGLLSRELSGLAAITEQGSSRAIFHVSGPDARATLAKGVPVDIDARVFKVGDAAQTIAGHIGLGIALLDASPRFEIVSALSTRGSLLSWLLSSAAEYGIEIA